MERTNTEYLHQLFDKYNIRHNTEIGFDFDSNEKITAFDLTLDFAKLNAHEQVESMINVVSASCQEKSRQEIINALFDSYLIIRKINRMKV